MFNFAISSQGLLISTGIALNLLGIVYLIQIKSIAKGFKFILTSHKYLFTMGLSGIGLFCIFIGTAVETCAIINPYSPVSKGMFFLCAAMLVLLGILVGSSGGKSDFVIFKIGAVAKIAAAMLMIAAVASSH